MCTAAATPCRGARYESRRPILAAKPDGRDPGAQDPGENVLVTRVALPAGGGALFGADGIPGYLATGLELGLVWGDLESSHRGPQFDRLLRHQPLHPAVGYLAQFQPEAHDDRVGSGRVYAELQYEDYENEKSPGFGPGFLLGAGPFFEHGSNVFGGHASLCGWFIGVVWVRPCVRPGVRSDSGFELSGFLNVQGYLETYSSR